MDSRGTISLACMRNRLVVADLPDTPQLAVLDLHVQVQDRHDKDLRAAEVGQSWSFASAKAVPERR